MVSFDGMTESSEQSGAFNRAMISAACAMSWENVAHGQDSHWSAGSARGAMIIREERLGTARNEDLAVPGGTSSVHARPGGMQAGTLRKPLC